MASFRMAKTRRGDSRTVQLRHLEGIPNPISVRVPKCVRVPQSQDSALSEKLGSYWDLVDPANWTKLIVLDLVIGSGTDHRPGERHVNMTQTL